MKVIGLTGGIGSGKTTVAQLFEIMDVPVYNSDNSAKNLMELNPEIREALRQHFGDDVFLNNGSLNRKLLGALIFKDVEALHWINTLVHPLVAMDFDIWKSRQKHQFIIKESALLIETLRLQTVDKIIVVRASKSLRLERVKSRDQLSESEILKRMQNQLEDEQRILFADYIIENEGSLSVIRQTVDLYRSFLLL